MLRNRRANYPVDILPLHNYEEKPKFFRGNHRYWILLMILIVLFGSGGIIYIAVSRMTIPPDVTRRDKPKAATTMDRLATHMDHNDMHEASHSMENRIMHMQEACLQYLGTDQQSEQIKFENMIYNRSNKIFYCAPLKTGSTNFIVHFLKLAGIKEKILKKKASTLHKKAQAISARISFLENIGLGRDNSMRKIITVRHPFERLISAYRTVFKKKSAIFTAHQHIAFTIIKNYHNPKFPPSKDRVHPTFDEFVRYLIYKAEVGNNPYWTPYFYYCSPCNVNYNYIVKMETSTRDQQFLLKQVHLDDVLKPQEMNVNPEGRTSMEIVERYLSKVTSGDLKLLQAKYDVDFRLFNYDSYPYMKFATKGEAVQPATSDLYYGEEHGTDEDDEEEREEKKYDEYMRKKKRKKHGNTEDNDLKDIHNAKIHADNAQDVKKEKNLFLSDDKNIFQDKEKHDAFQDTGSKNNVIQDKAGEHNVVQDRSSEENIIQGKAGEYNMDQNIATDQMAVQDTAGEHLVQDATSGSNMAQDRAKEHNAAQNITGVHNVVEDAVGQSNVVQDTGQHSVVQDTGQHSVVQDTAGEHSIVQDTAGEHSIVQDTAGEHSIVQDTAGEHSIVQDTAGEHSIVQDTATEQKAAQNTAKEQVVQDATSESNTAQDIINKNNVAHETADEHHAAQNTAGIHDVAEDATDSVNVVQETHDEHDVIQNTGEHKVVQDTSEQDIPQNDREEYKVINTDEYNEERKSDDKLSVVQGNTEHHTVQETLSGNMVKEESNVNKDDNK